MMFEDDNKLSFIKLTVITMVCFAIVMIFLSSLFGLNSEIARALGETGEIVLRIVVNALISRIE